MTVIRTAEELRTIYKPPVERAVLKQMSKLDKHAHAFLQRSPFVMIGSCAQSGRADVSPKGDKPGFVRALDDNTVAVPDRPGNNRLDTYENLLTNPSVGLLFMIPGMNETLRINGRAEININPELMKLFEHDGRLPLSVMTVKVEEVYLHCAKAFMRSELWNPDSFMERSSFPSFGAMLKDQAGLQDAAADIDRSLTERYKATLY